MARGQNIKKEECKINPQIHDIERDSGINQVDNNIHTANLSLDIDNEWIKIKIRGWAKAVASNNDKEVDRRLNEIGLLMDDRTMPAK